jgi:flagellar biosynthesis/type III secretory pathway M-ring protein FliF/YscJ
MRKRETPTSRGWWAGLRPAHLAWLGAALVLAGLAPWPRCGSGSTAVFAQDAELARGPAQRAPEEPGALADVLAHQAEHDRWLAREANEFLEEVLGPGRARVGLRSSWDFARHTERNERPGKRVALREARTLEPNASKHGGAVQEETDFIAARTSEERVDSSPRLARLSIALFLDPRAPDTPELRAALRAVLGYDASRGDEFECVVLPLPSSTVARAAGESAQSGALAPLGAWILPFACGLALALAWRGRHSARPRPLDPPEPPRTAAPRTEPHPRERVEQRLRAEPEKIGAVLSRWAREEPLEARP